MQIDWTHFSPLSALAGGALIGGSAGLTALLIGRVAGISGILSGLFPPRPGDVDWRIVFLFGLFASALLIGFFETPARPAFQIAYPLTGFAGFLVGFGSRLGGGCTSGHGVCGLSRLSLRSLVATCTFMGSAMTTVFVVRHVIG
ncbi:YeeE/YedE family protein [Methylocystis echinoides]|uniref:YeeE/YedE family protein n=1 Tax=Methylocystis echinoides TaxID=29468 RepID=UPI002491CCA5|nr:YeeE/YedE family protein [Methylocystis echinoides]